MNDTSTVTIYGLNNKLVMVNPEKCKFIAYYRDKVIYGNNLIDTGWKELPDGIIRLEYLLSTGKIIKIPNKFDSYMHLVEVSQSMFGNKVYHSVVIKCAIKSTFIDYKIILKEGTNSKYKIGDIVIDKCESKFKSPYWKLAQR